MTNQEKVLQYISDKKTNPLRFNGSPHLRKIEDLDELVYKILKHTKHYRSINIASGLVETNPNRWRSSLDIWRHVIYYKPNYTIFDVMNSLYILGTNNKVFGQYCHLIYRRTFKTKGYVLADQWKVDEYNLTFDEWKDINK